MTEVKEITAQEVLDNKKNGVYDVVKSDYVTLKKLHHTHVEDADMSVNWNNAFIEENNNKLKEQELAYREARNEKNKELTEDAIRSLAYDHGLTIEEANAVYWFLYDQHHSYGIHEILNCADEVVELIEKIKKIHGI